MERIAPLAKILAEANGIDWQNLRGSGDGGMVVEQDILNYLSRIMSGEEEPPATPVDLPPPDWNGDVNAMPDMSGMSADQLSRAGVDADIAALLRQSAPPAPGVPGVPELPGAPEPTSAHELTSSPGLHHSPEVPATPAVTDLDAEAMEFELDDADEEADDEPAAPAAAAAPAAPSLGGWEWNASAPAAPADIAPPAVELPQLDLPEVAPVAAVGAAAGLGSLLSRLYQQTPAETQSEAHPEAPAQEVPAHKGPAQEVPGSPPVDATPAPDVSPPAFETEVTPPEAMAAEPAAAHFGLAEPQRQPESELQPHGGAELGRAEQPEQSRAEQEVAPVPVEASETTGETGSEAAEAGPAGPMPSEPVSSEPVSSEAAPSEPLPSEAAPTATVPADAMPAEAAPQAAAVDHPRSGAEAAQGAVWFGTYLRRDADLGALGELHGQLIQALGQELPLALLVARAAQHHLALLGLDSVALHDHTAGRSRSVAGETLRAATAALAYDYEGTPDLLVVDAGALELDDLHYPHTLTLSLGRLHEGRAALSLNGDVDAARGAEFLSAVARTLGQPVLLLL